jgi:hypothetical protein
MAIGRPCGAALPPTRDVFRNRRHSPGSPRQRPRPAGPGAAPSPSPRPSSSSTDARSPRRRIVGHEAPQVHRGRGGMALVRPRDRLRRRPARLTPDSASARRLPPSPCPAYPCPSRPSPSCPRLRGAVRRLDRVRPASGCSRRPAAPARAPRRGPRRPAPTLRVGSERKDGPPGGLRREGQAISGRVAYRISLRGQQWHLVASVRIDDGKRKRKSRSRVPRQLRAIAHAIASSAPDSRRYLAATAGRASGCRRLTHA